MVGGAVLYESRSRWEVPTQNFYHALELKKQGFLERCLSPILFSFFFAVRGALAQGELPVVLSPVAQLGTPASEIGGHTPSFQSTITRVSNLKTIVGFLLRTSRGSILWMFDVACQATTTSRKPVQVFTGLRPRTNDSVKLFWLVYAKRKCKGLLFHVACRRIFVRIKENGSSFSLGSNFLTVAQMTPRKYSPRASSADLKVALYYVNPHSPFILNHFVNGEFLA